MHLRAWLLGQLTCCGGSVDQQWWRQQGCDCSLACQIRRPCLPHPQATESFRELVAAQPELGLDFVREASLRLGCPSLPAPEPAPEPDRARDGGAACALQSPGGCDAETKSASSSSPGGSPSRPGPLYADVVR
jgi:hypothetical protein